MPVVVEFPLTSMASVVLSFGSMSVKQGLLFPRRYTCDTVPMTVKVTSPQAFTEALIWSVHPGQPSKVS